MKKVLVTGGTGFIGRQVVKQLLGNGATVYVLTRRDHCESDLDKSVRMIRGDIVENFEIPSEVSTVYHCAGVLYKTENMERVNVHGTQRVVQAAMEKNCRLIHLSSAGVIGPTRLKLVDENTNCFPKNMYEETKHKAEQIVTEAVTRGLKAQMIRPTIVFGVKKNPQTDSFLQLARAVARGRYRHIGSGNSIYNIVHVDEVARAMCVLDDDSLPANGGIYFINTPLTFDNFCQAVMMAAKGKQSSPSQIPFLVAFCAAAIFSVVSRATRKENPLSFSRLRALTNQVIYSQKRLLEMTAYKPLYGVEEYVGRVCQQYVQQGDL